MDITNDELFQAYKKEKYGKKKERLHAMCKIKINESTIAETSNQMFCTCNSVRNWLDSFEKYGLEGLEDPPSFWSSAINLTQKITKDRAYI